MVRGVGPLCPAFVGRVSAMALSVITVMARTTEAAPPPPSLRPAAPTPPTTPTAWDYIPKQTFEVCVDGNTEPGQWNNTRLLHLAVPDGPPPPKGWPVLVQLLVVPFGSTNGTVCKPGPTPAPPTAECAAGLASIVSVCGGGPNATDQNNHTAEYACLRCVYTHHNVTSACQGGDIKTWCHV